MRYLRSCFALTIFLLPSVVHAATPPCRPCAGLHVDDPAAVVTALGEAPALQEEARLYVAWDVDLSDASAGAQAAALEEVGATPWLHLLFQTPTPIAEHLEELEDELRRATALARSAGPTTHFQVLWIPDRGWNETDYAFLYKRAAVAISGARPGARVLSQPLDANDEGLRAFYGQETSAYLDGVALYQPAAESLERTLALLAELDPGKPVVVAGIAFPDEPGEALAKAAGLGRAGVAVTFFDRAAPSAADLAPMVVLANEFQGDLSFDPTSVPAGADAWTYVRGSDLGLRVIARAPAGADELVLDFTDSQLRGPERIDPATGEPELIFGLARTAQGLRLTLNDPDPVTVIRLERVTAAELEGIEEELTVSSDRQIPVEEILRRLQTFEDAQIRRIEHYQATNTTHLRFQATGGAGTFEASLEGDFFFRPGQGYDWAWQDLYVNGIRWRGKTLPEIPLIQPEKAATMPLNIELSKRYVYRLRGSETVDGRDCWVVEFRPAEQETAEAEKLFRGTVWVDKEIYARVKTKALQLGLEGEVLSNEETVFFNPLDLQGQTAAWSAGSFFLPTRTVAQQLLSVLNTTTVVEREILLTNVRLNDPSFEDNRQAVLDSEATMVRDTERGLRYLVADEESGERVVKEGFDANKLFLLGGVFYDDSADFPIPLAGLNYLSLDFKGTGNQFNVFFAGALLTADYADPRLFGSKWDIGADAFVLAIPLSDSLYRDGEEILGEEIESSQGNVSFLLGRPLGNFFKFGFEYELEYIRYGETDETDDAFVLPSDHLTHSLGLELAYARNGYRLNLSGSFNKRSEWEPWGLPGSSDYDPEHEDFVRWRAVAAKNFYLKNFQRIGVELEVFGGEDLDRFSKFGFGNFDDTQVQGYQSGLVTAEEGYAAHFSYGFEIGEAFRLEGIADVAAVSDERSGLEDEVLAGVGIAGQFLGPWQTIVQVDVGAPVAGPDDGFSAFLVFLKLFK